MPQDLTNLKILGIPCPMIHVQPVPFQMENRRWRSREEQTHTVHIQKTYYIAQYPVTQALYQAIMNTNPSYFKGANRPVESISWLKAVTFIKQLNEVSQLPFRLPTEAEWELAARGGQYSQKFEYAGSDDLKQVGWYRENSGGETKPVGLLMPNELGLYDMSGNVWEWCMDQYQDYKIESRKDKGDEKWEQIKKDKNSVTRRVVRGGSYFFNYGNCRAAYRYNFFASDSNLNIGFRLVFPQV